MSNDFAATVPKITGSISAVSSSLIIYLIYRSKPKLSTIYHRIMLGMSVADIMASTAMALTTLPMPGNDDPYWAETFSVAVGVQDGLGTVYWRDQTKLGTRQTCAAQGFFFVTGIFIMFSYNGTLCVYYACAIALRMKEANIRKKIEPVIHGLPLLIGLAPVIPSFIYGFYNPTMHDAWCTLYPLDATGVVGQQGLESQRDFLKNSMLVGIGILFFNVLISFTLIIWRVVQNGRQLAQADRRGDIQIDERFKAAHRNSRLIISQSLAYTGAILLTLIFPIVRNMLSQTTSIGSSDPLLTGMSNLTMIFMPLQGFFNFTIFLWHKVENYRRANPAVGFFHVVRLLFSSSAEEPVLISRLSRLKVDEEEKRLEAEVYDELLEMYDDLEEPASLQSVGGLSRMDTIAGPVSIGEAVITYPDIRSTKLVHYRGIQFQGQSDDDLEEPASLKSGGGLSRVDTIACPASTGEAVNYHYYSSPDVRIEKDRAPTPFRRKGGQGVENESFQSNGDLSMGSRGSFFSLSLFSGERSKGNASRSLGGGSGLSQDEPEEL